MAKKDDVILIIAKAFSKQTFTIKETETSKELTVSTLVTEYGLNDVQALEVINWCILSCAALGNKESILEEGMFSFLDRFKKNKAEIAFKALINTKSNAIGIPEFLRDVSSLLSIIYKEGGIKDYITIDNKSKRDHPPESDWQILRLKKILGKLLTLEREFKKAVPSSARKMVEYYEPDINDLNQKAASIKIMQKIGKYLDDGSYTTLNPGYYDKGIDLTRMVRPLLRKAGEYKFEGKYKLSKKEVNKLALRFELFISQLKNQLQNELNKYSNSIKSREELNKRRQGLSTSDQD